MRVLDRIGRTTRYLDRHNNNETLSTYDRDHRLTAQTYLDAADASKNATTTFSYFADTADTQAGASATAAGALAKTVLTPQSAAATAITTDYTYSYWDHAQQASIKKTPTNPNAPGWQPGHLELGYNANGHLQRHADLAAGLTTTYFSSAAGLVLKRERQQVRR